MKTKKLALWGLFVAVTVICGWLSFPLLGIPVTMQSFAIFLALLTLGGKGGTVVTAVYLLLGGVGLPVFSGFHGGFGALFGATGGFLWGLLALCLVYWLVTALWGEKMRLLGLILGQLLCYALGGLWYGAMFAGGQSLPVIFSVTVLPFLLPDGGKLLLALWLGRRFKGIL